MSLIITKNPSYADFDKVEQFCFHCGLKCYLGSLQFEEKSFCCKGCQTVYSLLNSQGLSQFYQNESYPGSRHSQNEIEIGRYDYLNDQGIQSKLLDFKQDSLACITLSLPQIHCASCIWLLEHIYKINTGIVKSQVNFLNKTARVTFDLNVLKLSELVILLTKIGYSPDLTAKKNDESLSFYKANKRIITQLGLAGFCFGNVMMLSFPEYLSSDIPEKYRYFFSICTFFLTLPTLIYSAQDWFKGAYHSLKQKMISMDLPIVIGISVLFIISCIEIFYHKRIGYLDSLCAFIFFLLLARLFQSKTFHSLSFDKEIGHFFPLFAMKLINDVTVSVPLNDIKIGDVVYLRHGEVLSVSGSLLTDDTLVDYSFITGESEPLLKRKGESLSLGGRIIGQPAKVLVSQIGSDKTLNSFWASTQSTDSRKNIKTFAEKISPYFVFMVMGIAIIGFFASYMIYDDFSKALMAFACVFIVTCPCALAISSPLVQGLVIRYLSKYGTYVKDGRVIEAASRITDIVFDKTGTLTYPRKQIEVVYEELDEEAKRKISSVAHGSIHPISNCIVEHLNTGIYYEVKNFKEVIGNGISANVNGSEVLIGRFEWLKKNIKKSMVSDIKLYESTCVVIDEKLICAYSFNEKFRIKIPEILKSLKSKYKLHMISGDHNKTSQLNSNIHEYVENALYELKPSQKSDFIHSLNESGASTLMIGDGLNDSGALKKSRIGIALLEEESNFSPSSDIILEANKIGSLPKILSISNYAMTLIKLNLCLSILYNIFGIYIAVSGVLTPVYAAILMPLSSLSVLLLSVIGVWWYSWRNR